eukprot:scaffold54438_cov21-Tisochrysis_lutea.AAC.1
MERALSAQILLPALQVECILLSVWPTWPPTISPLQRPIDAEVLREAGFVRQISQAVVYCRKHLSNPKVQNGKLRGSTQLFVA